MVSFRHVPGCEKGERLKEPPTAPRTRRKSLSVSESRFGLILVNSEAAWVLTADCSNCLRRDGLGAEAHFGRTAGERPICEIVQ